MTRPWVLRSVVVALMVWVMYVYRGGGGYEEYDGVVRPGVVRVVAMSDTHGHTGDEVIVPDGDILIHAGWW